MEPAILDKAGWDLIGNTIGKLTVFTVLMIIGAFSMLLSRIVLPSLALTGELAKPFHLQRQILLGVGILAFLLAIVQLARVVDQTLTILHALYPRFLF
jgi:hypothetical protein